MTYRGVQAEDFQKPILRSKFLIFLAPHIVVALREPRYDRSKFRCGTKEISVEGYKVHRSTNSLPACISYNACTHILSGVSILSQSKNQKYS